MVKGDILCKNRYRSKSITTLISPYLRHKHVKFFFHILCFDVFGFVVLACSIESAILRSEAIKAGHPEGSLVNVRSS